jgi:MFS family permease
VNAFIKHSDLLRRPNGRKLTVAVVACAVAQGLVMVALPWLVLEGGAGAAESGLVLGVYLVPAFALTLPAGRLGDRLSRKPLLVGSAAVIGASALALAVLALLGGLTLTTICLLAAGVGTGRVLFETTAFAAMASVAKKKERVVATGTLTSAYKAALRGSPAIGAGLIALVGVPVALIAVAGLCAVCMAAAHRLGPKVDRGLCDEAPPLGESLAAAGHVLFRTPLRVIVRAEIAWNLLALAAIGMIVPLLRQENSLSPNGATLVLGAGAAGATLAIASFSRLRAHRAPLALFGGSTGCYAVACLSLSLLAGPIALAGLWALAMWANATGAAVAYGERNVHAPKAVRAITFSLGLALINLAGFGGTLGAGLVASHYGLHAVYRIVGVGMVLVAVGLLAAHRHADAPDEAGAHPAQAARA